MNIISSRISISVRLLCIPIVVGLLASGCDALSSSSDDSPKCSDDWWKSGVGFKITEQKVTSVIPKFSGECDVNEHVVEEVNGNTMTVGDGPDDEDDFLNLGGRSKEIEFEVSENAGTYQDNNKDVLTLRVPYESLNEQILTFLRSKTDIREQYDCG